MVKKNPDEFQIRFTENEHMDDDSIMREEIIAQRLEKLSTRVTLISIMVPVLIFVIFTFAYLDMKSRIFSMQDTGVDKLQKLSRDLESRFSSLSVRFAKFEDSFAEREASLKGIEDSFSKKIAPMEKAFSTLETSMKDVEKNLQESEKNIREIIAAQADHVEKKHVEGKFEVMEKSLEDMENSFEAAQKDMQTVMSQMKALDTNFKNELKLLTDYLAKEKKRLDVVAGVSDEFSKDMKNVQTQLQVLSKKTDGFVHVDDLPLAVEKARLKLKVALDEAVEKMQNRMDVLERQISSLSSKSGPILERNLQ
jgi:DNA repair exonuclease SbcCD ATPase subunit